MHSFSAEFSSLHFSTIKKPDSLQQWLKAAVKQGKDGEMTKRQRQKKKSLIFSLSTPSTSQQDNLQSHSAQLQNLTDLPAVQIYLLNKVSSAS